MMTGLDPTGKTNQQGRHHSAPFAPPHENSATCRHARGRHPAGSGWMIFQNNYKDADDPSVFIHVRSAEPASRATASTRSPANASRRSVRDARYKGSMIDQMQVSSGGKVEPLQKHGGCALDTAH